MCAATHTHIYMHETAIQKVDKSFTSNMQNWESTHHHGASSHSLICDMVGRYGRRKQANGRQRREKRRGNTVMAMEM